MASQSALVPGAGNGTGPGTPPDSPAHSSSCPKTFDVLRDLLAEKVINRTIPCPIDDLTQLCKAVLEHSIPKAHKQGVQDAQPGQDLIQDAGKGEAGGAREQSLDEFQITKAVVLSIVTAIILLSICKMVFQLFVRYAAKADDRGH